MPGDSTLELGASLGHYHPATTCAPMTPGWVVIAVAQVGTKSNEHQRGQQF
jgi:hypothetical protein